MMSLQPKHKKAIAIIIFVIAIPLQLLFLFVFFITLVDGESDSSAIFSTLFVMGLICFLLFYAARLWKEAKTQLLAKEMIVNPETIIQITARITLAEYRKLMFLLTYSRPAFVYVTFLSTSMLIFGLINGTADYWTWFFGFLVAYLPFAIYRSAGSNFNATKAIHEPVHYEFTPAQITVTGNTFNMTQSWSTLHQVKETKNGSCST